MELYVPAVCTHPDQPAMANKMLLEQTNQQKWWLETTAAMSCFKLPAELTSMYALYVRSLGHMPSDMPRIRRAASRRN